MCWHNPHRPRQILGMGFAVQRQQHRHRHRHRRRTPFIWDLMKVALMMEGGSAGPVHTQQIRPQNRSSMPPAPHISVSSLRIASL